MTLEIVVLNQKRTLAVADSMVTIDDCKTYDGEQKIFKITDRLSTILLLSGNSEFEGQKLKNLIDEYVSKTDFNQINSIEEIKETLNKSIANSSSGINIDEYVKITFDDFEKFIKKSISQYDTKKQKIDFLKINSFDYNIDFLTGNKLLNSKIMKLTHHLFDVKSKNELNEINSYICKNYSNFLVKDSPNIVLIGYDQINENPTYINYALLMNNKGRIETIEMYSVHNCDSTMIIGIAQDDEVDLILTGINDVSFKSIQLIVFELIEEFCNFNQMDEDILNSINEKLIIKINDFKLNNLKSIIDYIKILPDTEIFELLDALIVLTSIKMKFSSKVHSVGGKRHKVVLRKYEDINIVE